MLLDRGVHTWIVGVAMCLSHLCGIMCRWGLIFEGPKNDFFLLLMWLPMYWAYLNFKVWVICASVIFPEMVGEFLVYLFVG